MILLKKILCLLPLWGAFFIAIFGLYEWYDKNKIYYHLWYIPTSIILIYLIFKF